MGWQTGSSIFRDLILVLKGEVKDVNARRRIYLEMIQSFWSEDWDTEDDLLGIDPAYDEALKYLDPDKLGHTI